MKIDHIFILFSQCVAYYDCVIKSIKKNKIDVVY